MKTIIHNSLTDLLIIPLTLISMQSFGSLIGYVIMLFTALKIYIDFNEKRKANYGGSWTELVRANFPFIFSLLNRLK